jgi:magnesium-transporting ATPase (P-type)
MQGPLLVIAPDHLLFLMPRSPTWASKKTQHLDSTFPANGNGLSKPAHALTFSQVTEDIKANAENGLSTLEAKERHSKYGTNELGDAGGVEPGKILIRQIANAMTLVCSTSILV